jgi:YVTN family beta-propeller protein
MFLSRRSVLKSSLATLALVACASCGDSSTGNTMASRGRVYATVSSTGEVVAIDDSSREIVQTYKVGRGPAILLGSPDFGQLYTANWADNSVSIVEAGSGSVTTVALDSRPYVIAADHTGMTIYAGLESGKIAVIDTEQKSIVRTLLAQELPASIIVSPDDRTLYVAYIGLGVTAGRLVALSAATGAVTKDALSVGMSPAWITISHDGSRVYTLNFLSDDVTVVDTATWSVVATVSTGPGSQGIIGNVTPDDSRLYVTAHGTSSLIAIDTHTNEVVQTIALRGRPVGVNVSPDGSRVYVTDFGPQSLDEPPQVNYLLTGQFTASGNGKVSAFDTATGEELGAAVETGPGPTSVIATPAL